MTIGAISTNHMLDVYGALPVPRERLLPPPGYRGIGMVKPDRVKKTLHVYISDVQDSNIKLNNVVGKEERLYKRRGKTECVCLGSGVPRRLLIIYGPKFWVVNSNIKSSRVMGMGSLSGVA